MGEKHETKLLKAIEDYQRIAGRYLLDAAETQAEKITEHLRECAGIEQVTPAGSLRRGRETVGDLDILVTGPACRDDAERQKLIDHIIKLPGLMEIIARGENKVSFRMRGGMQVDVRLLPPESFRGGHAVLHGIEGPQCCATPAGAEDGLHAQRIQPGAAGG